MRGLHLKEPKSDLARGLDAGDGAGLAEANAGCAARAARLIGCGRGEAVAGGRWAGRDGPAVGWEDDMMD